MNHKYEVKIVMDHYELHIDGKFYCSCDNWFEINKEIEEFEIKENS